MAELWNAVKRLADFTLLRVGQTDVTVGRLLFLTVSVVAVFLISNSLARWLLYQLNRRKMLDIGVSQAVSSIVRYVLILLGLVIIMDSSGLELNAFLVAGGALGVGIGFGLQSITNNMVSGFIILFERPIKVGDRIEVGEVRGDVVRISTRATTVVTNDNISVLVPNSQFITSTIINWSHNDRNVRLRIPVGVSYKSDPEQVRRVLLDVAAAHPGILKNPPADVLFTDYEDSALKFELRVWTTQFISRPGVLKSDLNYAIFQAFKKNHIEIPYPQRDVHIRTQPS